MLENIQKMSQMNNQDLTDDNNNELGIGLHLESRMKSPNKEEIL